MLRKSHTKAASARYTPTHTNAHARVCANATAVHMDEKLFVGSLEFCKHQAGLQTDNSLKLVYREFGALQTDIVGLN